MTRSPSRPYSAWSVSTGSGRVGPGLVRTGCWPTRRTRQRRTGTTWPSAGSRRQSRSRKTRPTVVAERALLAVGRRTSTRSALPGPQHRGTNGEQAPRLPSHSHPLREAQLHVPRNHRRHQHLDLAPKPHRIDIVRHALVLKCCVKQPSPGLPRPSAARLGHRSRWEIIRYL
jgi:hypothetical protein